MLSIQMPLTTKHADGVLRVLAIGRVSTLTQDVENINASYRQVEDLLRKSYQGPMHIKQGPCHISVQAAASQVTSTDEGCGV